MLTRKMGNRLSGTKKMENVFVKVFVLSCNIRNIILKKQIKVKSNIYKPYDHLQYDIINSSKLTKSDYYTLKNIR